MTKKEIEEHFAMHKYAPLQEIYKTYSGGQKFNEGCYTCLAVAQQVMFNNVDIQEKQARLKEFAKEIVTQTVETPKQNGNRKTKGRK